jgi:hypothetical protein
MVGNLSRRTYAVCSASFVIALASCASAPGGVCPSGQLHAVYDSLFFGTAKPIGTVSKEDWATFVNSTVTPRFPQGLTVSLTNGQWKSSDGTIIRESSYVLTLIHPDDNDNEQAVRDITNAYKAQFQQEAVLRIKLLACVSY